ncbi:MAG: hypothetical protein AVDCRST_MAG59-1527, partial [uncultured Thermomicrobiales bacterium]
GREPHGRGRARVARLARSRHGGWALRQRPVQRRAPRDRARPSGRDRRPPVPEERPRRADRRGSGTAAPGRRRGLRQRPAPKHGGCGPGRRAVPAQLRAGSRRRRAARLGKRLDSAEAPGGRRGFSL